MAQKGYRNCKYCGKEYEYCRTFRPTDVFRWQDVACCPEHAALYVEQVQIARGEKPAPQAEPAKEVASAVTPKEVEPKQDALSKNNFSKKKIYR